MSPDLAVPSSPAPPLGRKRTVHHDLPPRMARKGTRFYYVSNAPRQWIPLGNDLALAKRRWAEHEAGGRLEGLTVGELVQRYIDREERPAGTLKQYRSYQKTLAKEFPDQAADIRSYHVATWREAPAQRRRKGYVNGCISILEAAFRIGHEQGACELLSVSKWEMKPRDYELTDAQFIAVRRSAPDWLKAAMGLGYLTALRPSDIRKLMWTDVGEGVGVRTRKTSQRMRFTMTPELEDVLAEARTRKILGLYVIANEKGKPIPKNAFEKAWRDACDAAGVKDAEFRDIRAKAALDAQRGGQNYQALLGHTTKRMSDRYLRGRGTVTAEPVRRKL